MGKWLKGLIYKVLWGFVEVKGVKNDGSTEIDIAGGVA